MSATTNIYRIPGRVKEQVIEVSKQGEWSVVTAQVFSISVFPINIMGLGGSLVTLVNWFGSCAVLFTFNFLMEWSSYGTFFLYAAICATGIVFIYKVVPETKGRTLEEIQNDLTS